MAQREYYPKKKPIEKVEMTPALKKLTTKPRKSRAKTTRAAELALKSKQQRLVKDVVAGVFNDLQHTSKFSLKTWAMANPTKFYELAAKLMPVQLTGDGGGPIELKNVTFE
jgi:hypothetical protein